MNPAGKQKKLSAGFSVCRGVSDGGEGGKVVSIRYEKVSELFMYMYARIIKKLFICSKETPSLLPPSRPLERSLIRFDGTDEAFGF